MNANQYLINFYNGEKEDRRLASRCGSVEFLTTMHYIDKYLKTGDKVLEIGAGTGRYSHNIARRGYAVDAIELVESNIEVFRRNTQADEKINISQGNAMDLSGFPDNAYDIVLVLGPMYHLFNIEDKRQVIKEAIRVTKQGGIVFTAYCMSDPSLLGTGFKNKGFDLFEMINKGFIDPKTFEASSAPELVFEVVRKEHIDAVMEVFNVRRLHFVGTDLYTNHMPDAVESMSEEMFELYLRYHFAVCERADMVGISHHTLDIFSKS